ncbi:unnamed protein product [Parajaminaea phylloscopi]
MQSNTSPTEGSTHGQGDDRRGTDRRTQHVPLSGRASKVPTRRIELLHRRWTAIDVETPLTRPRSHTKLRIAMADAAKTPANGAAAEAAQTPKAIIKNVDMSEEMQQLAVDIAQDALAKFTVEKDIAAHVKRTMDQKIGPTWHAVVGKNFGSYVTHETKHFIYFYLGSIAFLLWRA